MNDDEITEIFVQIDDFTQLFDAEIRQLRLESSKSKSRNRKSKLYLSKHYKHLFPDLVSYERFVQSS